MNQMSNKVMAKLETVTARPIFTASYRKDRKVGNQKNNMKRSAARPTFWVAM